MRGIGKIEVLKFGCHINGEEDLAESSPIPPGWATDPDTFNHNPTEGDFCPIGSSAKHTPQISEPEVLLILSRSTFICKGI